VFVCKIGAEVLIDLEYVLIQRYGVRFVVDLLANA
jgi:hypothetical protein